MRPRGATLIEILVVMGMAALIGGSMYLFLRNTFSLNAYVNESLSTQQEILKTLKAFTAEARSASESSLGAYPIGQAATSTFMFYSDIDDDGRYERVRYFLSGKVFKKGVIKPTGNPLTYPTASETVTNLVRDVTNGPADAVFTYFGSGYDGSASATPLASPVNIALVRLVKLNLTVDRTPATAPGVLQFTTQVSIRNLKDNL